MVTDSSASEPTYASLPNVTLDIGKDRINKASDPKAPRTKAVRLRVKIVRVIRCGSLVPTASAIWRTPLLFIPMPAIPPTKVVTELKAPNRPMPSVPIITARALVLTMPSKTLITEEPPIRAVDLNI